MATKLAQMVDGWKRRLLDLTRRNKALNFKPTRVSTVAVLDELPAEIFQQLVIKEGSMKFRPKEEESIADPEAPKPAPSFDDEELDVDEIKGAGVDFVPYESTTAVERHRDEWLQTSSTPLALDKSLRRIDEVARSTIQEQGVNTLYLTLGMLYYKESPDAEEVNKAPLVMVPVALSRKSARSGFVISAGDDEPLANPALIELLRRNYGISLPELPRSDHYPEDYDLQAYLADVAQRIALQKDWSVKNDVFLASFSFQKLVMYKDLETHHDAALGHRLVRQLATRNGSELIGLPETIRSMDLDASFPPENSFQVVDADSSQLRAIAAVAHKHDLVIEGPPGTGKSQTITNLIATSLAAGKSVLFVAEKQAALSVVHRRLVSAGLGEFCLELHSNKASKRAVMDQIGAALDASLQGISYPTSALQRLPQIRTDLTAYAKAVHAAFGALGWSPYRVYGEFARLLTVPRRPYNGAVDAVTPIILDETIRQLDALAGAVKEVGNPKEHPWRDAVKGTYLPTDLEEIGDTVTALERKLGELEKIANEVGTKLGFPRIAKFSEVNYAVETAAVLSRSPGAPTDVLQSSAWNQPPPEALLLVSQGRDLAKLKQHVDELFKSTVLEQEHADDIKFMEEKLGGTFSFLAFFSARYRAIKKRWMDYRQAAYSKTLAEQTTDLKLSDQLRRDRVALDSRAAHARTLFGQLWQGQGSDWAALDSYITWVTEFRQTCLRFHLDTSRIADVAARPTPSTADVTALATLSRESVAQLVDLTALIGWPTGYLADTTFPEILARLNALLAAVGSGPTWAAYEHSRREAAAGLGSDFVAAAQSGELPFGDLARVFQRAFFAKWLAACLRERPILERFRTLSHEERIAEFRNLDETVLRDNRARVVSQLRDTVQHRLKQPDAVAGMPVLRRELARQRGLQPLRLTLREAESAIRAIKPCFMMSPLTVAQFLDGKHPTFDVVIFDEASQLPAEDAMGAIVRGRQLVVVGDPKQLPPTSFFAGTNAPAFAEDGTPLAPDAESILEEFMGAGMPMSRLKWHYRSAHESLINFSNVSFYDGELFTFPSVETTGGANGLKFEYVADGIYEGKGVNPVEAKRVAQAVVEFARLQAERRASGEPTQTLGVGTFSLRQQLTIMDELEVLRRADPSLEPFFDLSGSEPFFVKNLENIQGDERDVIFISVTYAKGADTKLRQNFGPLNGENGWRRLNVLVSRARQCMRVFSSMRGEEINSAATTALGGKLLRDFLIYAERGRLDSSIESLGSRTESPFERDVVTELTLRGLQLVPQVGVAGYRIDLGVTDPAIPGRFICGIECDGAAYHSSETARDRDRLRQQVLEARGWTIHRLWSTSWFLDRAGQIDRLCQLVAVTKERLVGERNADRIARDREAATMVQKLSIASEQARREAEQARRQLLIPYKRMQAEPYVLTPFDPSLDRGDILSVPSSQIMEAIVTVIEVEGPIHTDDLCVRVAQMWRTKAGAKIARRIESMADVAVVSKRVLRNGDFWWRLDSQCRIRSRTETKTPADRIAPQEYEMIIRRVLSDGHGFLREQLVTEIRTVLGYARTGAALEEAIRSAIDGLLQRNVVGEGSTGIKLRIG
jgi:very-short-patch-repair endonuclease